MGTAITLLLIAIILIFLNLRALLKEKKSFQGILNNSEDNMDEFQVEIGKLRREFAETLLEIQTQLVEMEEKIQFNSECIKDQNEKHVKNENNINNLENYKDIVSFNDKIKDIVDIDFNNFNKTNSQNNEEKLNIENNEPLAAEENNETSVEQEDNNDNAENNSIKIKEVEKLLNKGLGIDEISDALKIGKGEVLLIKELYLK